MLHKILYILLCMGIVGLVSGCYCYPYPPGYYHHRAYRYSYASPFQSHAHHAEEAHGGA